MSDDRGQRAVEFVQAHLREGDVVYAYDTGAYELDRGNIFGMWKRLERGGTDVHAVVELAQTHGAKRLVNISDMELPQGHAELFDLNVHVDLIGYGPRYDHMNLPADLAQPFPDIRKL